MKALLIAALLVSTAAHADGTLEEDRALLGGLYAMKAICGIENGTAAPWVGDVLYVVGRRQGWSVNQMLAIGEQRGAPMIRNWSMTKNRANIKRYRADYCAAMKQLKRSTEKVFG